MQYRVRDSDTFLTRLRLDGKILIIKLGKTLAMIGRYARRFNIGCAKKYEETMRKVYPGCTIN